MTKGKKIFIHPSDELSISKLNEVNSSSVNPCELDHDCMEVLKNELSSNLRLHLFSPVGEFGKFVCGQMSAYFEETGVIDNV